MKSLLIRISVALALAASAISCTLEIQGDTSAASLKTISSFTASVGDEACTKLRLDDSEHLSWSFSESIGVYSDTDPVQVFNKYGENNVFEGSTPVSGNKFFAYYPYDDITVDPENRMRLQFNNSLCSTSSADQNIRLPMIARSDGSLLSFKHTAGVLHLTVKGTKYLQDVRINGNRYERLYGDQGNGYIDLEDEEPVLKIGDLQQWHTLSLWCTTEVQLSKDKPLDVYFVLPPMTFENGFTATIHYDGQTVVKTTNKRVIIERGKIKNFTMVDVDAELQEEEDVFIEERNALIALYNATDGPNWVNNENWCSDKPVSEWHGVMTDIEGRVLVLDLEQNGLNGALPAELSKLSRLSELYIQESKGEITNFDPIFDLPSLQVLRFGVGEQWRDYKVIKERMFAIPAAIAKLKNLRILLASGINDDVPEELFGMDQLEDLCIKGLETGKPLQSGFGSMKNLKALSLTGWGINPVYGELPESIYDLHNLQSLEIAGTNIGGALSPRIGELTQLYLLNLPGNKFSGPLPAELARLHLIDNRPANVGSQCINLENNDFSGRVPEAFRNWPEWRLIWGYIVAGNKNLDYLEMLPTVPDFTVKTLDGGAYSSLSVKDHELTLFLQWDCDNINISSGVVSEIKELYSQYKDKGFSVVSYARGLTEDYVREYAAQLNMPWPTFWNSLLEQGNTIGTDLYPYREVPCETIFDNSGRVVYSSFYANEAPGDFIQRCLGSAGPPYESTDFSADGTVHIIQTATRGAGIDLVLMGDAYSDRLIADGTYGKMMQRAADALFSEEPYKSFRDCFNVYYVDVVSKNEKYNLDTALGTWFGEGTSMGGNTAVVTGYAMKAVPEIRMDDALVIILVNRDYYAGTCYFYPVEGDSCDYGRGLSLAYCPAHGIESSFTGIVCHEAGGHGFAKLDDEYAYPQNLVVPQDFIDHRQSLAPNGWFKNIDFTSDPSLVKWSSFVSDSRYSGEHIGVYEGAGTFWTGAYRPTRNSIMNDNTGGFNAPSRYAIWYRIGKLAFGPDWNGSYEDFVAYDAVNRTPAAAAARRAARRNSVEKDFVPLAPPVVIEGGWRQ